MHYTEDEELKEDSKAQPTIISKQTLMPISMVLILLGGVAWLTSMYNQASAHTEKISSLEKKYEKIESTIYRMDKNITQIKFRMGIKDGQEE